MEVISESKSTRNPTGGNAIEVVDQGKNKTIYSQQILVVKPRGVTADAAKIATATKRIEGTLCLIQVNSLKERKSGCPCEQAPSMGLLMQLTNVLGLNRI